MTTLEDRLCEMLATKSALAPGPEGLVAAARSRHRRRRRAQVGGAALLVMASVLIPAGVLGRVLDHPAPSQPQPLGPYKYGQHQTTSQAVPAAQAPGFQTLHYDAPSSNGPIPLGPHAGHLGPTQEYLDIDAHGRLATMRVSHRQPSDFYLNATYQIVPGPDRAARPITKPAFDGVADLWTPHFTSDGRLLWQPSPGLLRSPWIDDRLTDLGGHHPRSIVPPSAVAVTSTREFPSQRGVWVDGGRVWFSAVTKARGAGRKYAWVTLFSYDPARPGQVRQEAPHDVDAIDVADGTAVWIDAGGTKAYAEDLTTRQVHEVPLPLGPGCSLPPSSDLMSGGFDDAVLTNGSLIALTEYCPDIRSTRELVVDLSGRLVTEFDPGHHNQIFEVSLGDQTIAFTVQLGSEGEQGHTSYLDDLATGELIDLGKQVPSYENPPRVSGRYVMWYAGPAGHVGRLAPPG